MKQATISENFQFSVFSKYSPSSFFVLQVPYLNPVFDPNFDQLSPSGYCVINFPLLAATTGFSRQNQVGHYLPHFSCGCPFVCTVHPLNLFSSYYSQQWNTTFPP